MATQLVFDFEEVWKPIPGHEGYEVSNLGRARSLDRIIHSAGDSTRGPYTRKWRGRALRLSPDASGYQGTYPFGRIHSAVMLAFVGPCPDGLEVRHLDGKKHNNKLSNLIYGTQSQNEADKVRHGTSNRGERHGMARLTETDVLLIRRSTLSNAQIADRFSVSEGAVRLIKARKRWGWLE